MREYVHVMTDTETLSTANNALLLSIGACRFDIETGQTYDHFKCVLDRSTVEGMGLDISADTQAFWNKQSKEAQDLVFNNPNQIDYKTGMHDYANWLIAMRCKSESKKMQLWANDPDFDYVKLAHSMSVNNILPPWQYWEHKSCRTMEFIGEKFGIDRRSHFHRNGIHHDALDDAIYQVQYVSGIWNMIGVGTNSKPGRAE